MNPATLAERAKADELRLLREDCVRLRERVKVLEGNLADAQNITAQVEANLNDPSVQESQKLKGKTRIFWILWSAMSKADRISYIFLILDTQWQASMIILQSVLTDTWQCPARSSLCWNEQLMPWHTLTININMRSLTPSSTMHRANINSVNKICGKNYYMTFSSKSITGERKYPLKMCWTPSFSGQQNCNVYIAVCW